MKSGKVIFLTPVAYVPLKGSDELVVVSLADLFEAQQKHNAQITQIFADLDEKFRSSGVYKKIAVRSYSHIRAKYGVPAKRK